MSHVIFSGKKMTFNEYENKFSSRQVNNKGKRKVTETKESISVSEYSQKKFTKNPPTNCSQPHSSNISHNQTHQTPHQPTTLLPVSHTQYASFNKNTHQHPTSHPQPSPYPQHPIPTPPPQHPSKIDLIFQKQPEDVQRKLRMLLLNYNAVMQYNQQQDKFQVDLLLPFGSLQEKERFVEKFVKTRQYIKGEVNGGRKMEDEMQQGESNNYQDEQNVQKEAHSLKSGQYHNTHKHQSEEYRQEVIQTNHIYQQKESFHNQKSSKLLDHSSEQQPTKPQQEKQLNQKDNHVDFYALSLSIDQSLKRAMTMINKNKAPGTINADTLQNNTQNNHPQTTFKEPNKESRYSSHTSQIQSQISQGLQANIPHSIQRNTHNTPSGYDKQSHSQSLCIKPIHHQSYQNQHKKSSSFDHSHQTLLQESRHNREIYESPISKQQYYEKYEKSNASSNEILIEDEIHHNNDDEEMYENYETFDRSYQSSLFPENSSFDMIEETAEEHQEDIFPSHIEYQEFLKNKLSSTGQNVATPSSRNSISSQQEGSIPSLRKKYAQFLKKNHKKIESLYLRIGKQMNLRKKKQALNSEQRNSAKDETNEILVVDDSDEKDSQNGILDDYKRRIVLENDSMSSEDKVRYFRYLARHAKGLYIDYIRNQKGSKRG